jgi:HAD superfamily hydrolase (TIGR01490 family)
MQVGKIAAFFDFDNTLLAGDSAEIGVKYLIRRREISIGFALWIWFLSRFYKRNLITVERMCDATVKLYKGRRLEEFKRGGSEFYLSELKPRLSPRLIEKLEDHRRQGHVLVLLSASLDYILREVALDLNFDHVLCSQLEEDENGLLTGHIDGLLCASDEKARAAQGLAQEIGIDLSRSFAYADHHSDIPILKLVGNPVAVEPTPHLKELATTSSWPILSYF